VSADERQPAWIGSLKQLAAVAAAIATILGLLFLLFPRLKPREPSQTRAASLNNVRVSPPEPEGIAVRFNAEITGYLGQRLPVLWTLYDTDTGRPARYPQTLGSQEAVRRKGSPTESFTPRVESESFSGEIHIPRPSPSEGRSWRVRLEIVDPGGKTIASIETEPFAVPH
jgi:hypothetical protein